MKSSDDVNDLDALTPNHLLAMRGVASLPWGNFDTADAYQTQWRYVQYMATQFWKRWTREYLPLLQSRQKWFQVKPNVDVGDLVVGLDLFNDDTRPSGHISRPWRLSAHRGWADAERTVALRHRGNDQAWSGRPGMQCDVTHKDLTVQEAYNQTGPFGRESSVQVIWSPL